MSNFKIVRQESDILLSQKWQVPTKKDIVSVDGKTTFDPADNRRFQVIGKYHVPYSLGARIAQIIVGIFAAIVSLGFLLLLRNVRGYFTNKIAASVTCAVPYGKIVEPYLPDPEGKKYPIDSTKSVNLALTLDVTRIRKSLDRISDNSLNKTEIIKDMLLAILQSINLPRDGDNAIDVNNAIKLVQSTCLAVAELLQHDVDLNDHFITISTEIQGDFKSSSKQFSSFLDTVFDSVLGNINHNDETDRVMAIHRPLINLLLANGAKTRLEKAGSDDGAPIEVVRLEQVQEIRRENAMIRLATKIFLPACEDVGSSLNKFPKEILQSICHKYVEIA